MDGDQKSLEQHSSNIFGALMSNSSENTNAQDPNKDISANNAKEQTKKEVDNTTDSDSNINKKDLQDQNADLKRINSNMVQEPLDKLVDNLEASANDNANNQQKSETKDITNNETTKETQPEIDVEKNQNNDNFQSNLDSTYDSYQSAGSKTEQGSQRSYSSSSTSSNTNGKNRPNNQPPKLQGKLPQIVFHSPDSLTYKALTLQPLPSMNRQTRSSVVLDLSTYIDQCTQEGMIAEANFILEVSESVKKIQTPRKIEIQQMQLKDNLDNCNNEIEAQNL